MPGRKHTGIGPEQGRQVESALHWSFPTLQCSPHPLMAHKAAIHANVLENVAPHLHFFKGPEFYRWAVQVLLMGDKLIQVYKTLAHSLGHCWVNLGTVII